MVKLELAIAFKFKVKRAGFKRPGDGNYISNPMQLYPR